MRSCQDAARSGFVQHIDSELLIPGKAGSMSALAARSGLPKWIIVVRLLTSTRRSWTTRHIEGVRSVCRAITVTRSVCHGSERPPSF